MRVIYFPEAREDIQNTLAHYAAHDRVVAESFFNDLQTALSQIEQFPQLARPLFGSVRRKLMETFPFGIIYRLVEDEIQVLAVAHTSRNPHYWKKRISK